MALDEKRFEFEKQKLELDYNISPKEAEDLAIRKFAAGMTEQQLQTQ